MAPPFDRLFLRLLWFSAACATLARLLSWYWSGIWPFDRQGHLRVYDFASFWAAAKRVLHGQSGLIYDGVVHARYEAGLLGQPVIEGLVYPYPPPSLLLIWPLGLGSYPVMWVVFAGLGLLIWFVVLRIITGDAIVAGGMALAIGGATQSLLLGQNGFYSASLICGLLLVLPRHKVLAGVLLGLLCFKPHLAAGSFLILALWREWRVIAIAAGCVSGLSLLATMIFGPGIWAAFLEGNVTLSQSIPQKQDNLIVVMMQSVLALTISKLGWVGASVAQAFWGLFAVAVAAWMRGRGARAAGVICATVLITPYSFVYDLTMLVGAAAFLQRDARGFLEHGLLAVAATIPGLYFLTNGGPYGAFAALIMLALALYQSQRLRREQDAVPV